MKGTKRLLAIVLAATMLVLAGCGETPSRNQSMADTMAVTLKAYTGPTRNYTVGAGYDYKEYLVELEIDTSLVYYMDSVYLDEDRILLTIGYQMGDETLAADVYVFYVEEGWMRGVYHAERPLYAEGYWAVYATPVSGGVVITHTNTLIFLDENFEETHRWELGDIYDALGGLELYPNNDFTLGAVTVLETDPQGDGEPLYALYLYDLETGQRGQVTQSYIQDPETGELAIPVVLDFASDGTLFYRYYDDMGLLPGLHFYKDGETRSVVYDGEATEPTAEPLQFLAGDSGKLICHYIGGDRPAGTVTGILELDGGGYTPLSARGEDTMVWWSREAETALVISNPLYLSGDFTDSDLVTYSHYTVADDSLTLMFGHPVSLDESGFLETGLPVVASISDYINTINYGLAISPTSKYMTGFTQVRDEIYLGVLLRQST